MGIYIYDYATSEYLSKEMYEFIIKTLHKVDMNLINYFFRLDCREIKLNVAKKYTDLSKIVFTDDEELLNILVENTMITELIAVLLGKHNCSIGKAKLIGKFNIIKNGVLK